MRYLILCTAIILWGCGNEATIHLASSPAPSDEAPAMVDVEPLGERINANWGSVLSDIVLHLKKEWYYLYYDRDTVTHAHESVHGINAHIRNHIAPDGVRYNGFYALDGKGVVVREPPLKKRDMIPYVPSIFHGSRYRLYVVGAQGWDDRPLYIFDEWTSYILGARTARARFEEGLWREGKRDCSGVMDFNILSIALGQFVQEKAPEYVIAYPQFLKFLRWNLEAGMNEHLACASNPLFSTEKMLTTYRQFTNHEDASGLRAFLRDTYGQDWYDATFPNL